MILKRTTRYTDYDVLNDERLPLLARDYIMKYKGEFAPLVAIRNLISAGELPTTQHVRVILNCMLNDANVVNMPEPLSIPYDASKYIRDNIQVFTTPKPSGEYEFTRPYKMPLRSKFNFDFATSTAFNGKSIHIVDHGHTPVQYYTRIRQFEVRVVWMCRQYLAPKKMKVLTFEEARLLVDTKQRLFCRRCVEASEGKWVLEDGCIIRGRSD